LAIREKVLGKEHPDTATTYNNIAGVYRAQSQYEEALEWYRKAYRIYIQVLGETHPYTQRTRGNMEAAYQKTRNAKPFSEWLAGAM
jgi:tetratricopeptide (TPR) repeat protein